MKLSCIGNALMDIISFRESEKATAMGFLPGTSSHVDYNTIMEIIASLDDCEFSAGGGACNTARVFSALGNKAGFAGALGRDSLGDRFETILLDDGVLSFLEREDAPSGVFLVFISPGTGERCIIVHQGAAMNLNPEKLGVEFFSNDSILYIDGFLANKPETLKAVIDKGQKAGMKIALDIAGQRLAVRNSEYFRELVTNICHWSFMNEDEFIALSGGSLEESLASFSGSAKGHVIVKRAEAGALCYHNGILTESPVRVINSIDSTGAGDSFSAGFLHAWLDGAPLARCLRAGNRVAEHIIQVPGVNIEPSLLKEALKEVS